MDSEICLRKYIRRACRRWAAPSFRCRRSQGYFQVRTCVGNCLHSAVSRWTGPVRHIGRRVERRWPSWGCGPQVRRAIRGFTTPLTFVHFRASKKIPSEIAQWTQYMKRQNGAVIFMLVAYTNAAGELAVSRLVHRKHFRRQCWHPHIRHETTGLGFIDNHRNLLRKGPNNIMDMWGSHVEGIYEYPRLDYVS